MKGYFKPLKIVLNIVCASVLFSMGEWYVMPLGLFNIAAAVFELREEKS